MKGDGGNKLEPRMFQTPGLDSKIRHTTPKAFILTDKVTPPASDQLTSKKQPKSRGHNQLSIMKKDCIGHLKVWKGTVSINS